MTFPLTHFFTHPETAWHELRDNADQHPAAYLPLWLLMPLLPAVCLFIGTTQVGWRLPGMRKPSYSALPAARFSPSGAMPAWWRGL